jgi:ElaB/YqjD/DUF883 family membrane-anchored ribosome-binding protein
MSEPKYSSSDIPRFDTYPSNSPQASSPRENGPGEQFQQSDSPRGLLEPARQSDLEIRAVRLGAALGHFVLLLRNQKGVAGQKLSLITEDATATLNQTADSLKIRAEEARHVARNKAQEMWTEAERRAEQLRIRAIHNLKRAHVRAQEIQRDNPEHVAVGAGAVGLALGIGLRIWRANRA